MNRVYAGELEWRRLLAAVPGMAATLLPIGACPACWAAYSGLLGAIGLGFVPNGLYVTLFAATLLGVSLASLVYRARARHGYGPFLLGIIGVAAAVAGRLVLPSALLLYAGIAMLATAAVWNALPRSNVHGRTCPACARASRNAQGSTQI